jgi:hypothetical protein
LLQKLTGYLFGGDIEFDPASNLLRSANRGPPLPAGIHPPKFEAVPRNFTPGPQIGPQPVKPVKPKAKTGRPGWLGGWA